MNSKSWNQTGVRNWIIAFGVLIAFLMIEYAERESRLSVYKTSYQMFEVLQGTPPKYADDDSMPALQELGLASDFEYVVETAGIDLKGYLADDKLSYFELYEILANVINSRGK